MKNQAITPSQALEKVLQLTKMTPEQYHTAVLDAGTAHARDVVYRKLPEGLSEYREQIIQDILTLPHFNFWAYFQNVLFLKNLRLIQSFGHLTPDMVVYPNFHATIWKNQLLPHRIFSEPSTNFPRLVEALIKGYMLAHCPREGVAK